MVNTWWIKKTGIHHNIVAQTAGKTEIEASVAPFLYFELLSHSNNVTEKNHTGSQETILTYFSCFVTLLLGAICKRQFGKAALSVIFPPDSFPELQVGMHRAEGCKCVALDPLGAFGCRTRACRDIPTFQLVHPSD
jgi:hypothetical protein